MRADLRILTEREKDTLRLLMAGHDAKSIARELDLSVHTVNDRLRNARAKLGVSSSREAARKFAEQEAGYANPELPDLLVSAPETFAQLPDSLAHRNLGIATQPAGAAQHGQSRHHPNKGKSLVWLAGGMIIMSLVIAAIALSSMTGQTGAGEESATPAPPQAAATSQTESEGGSAARAWLALVDSGQWDESWAESGTMFRAQLDSPKWTSMIEPVRQPLGPLVSRRLDNSDRSNALPGAPAGEYEVIRFRTSFENVKNAIETVTMVREDDGWAVIGYFIKPA